MNLNKEIENIKSYFSRLSIEEFDNIIEKNGINQISLMEDYDMSFLETITYKKTNHNKYTKNEELFEYSINNKISGAA